MRRTRLLSFLVSAGLAAYPSFALAADPTKGADDVWFRSAALALAAFFMILLGFGVAILGIRSLLRRGSRPHRRLLLVEESDEAAPQQVAPLQPAFPRQEKTLLLPLPPQVLPLPTLLESPPVPLQRPISPDATVQMDAAAILALEATLPVDARRQDLARLPPPPPMLPDCTQRLPALGNPTPASPPARELVSLFADDEELVATNYEPPLFFDDGSPAVEIAIPRPSRTPSDLRLVRSIPPPVPPARHHARPMMPIHRRHLRLAEEQQPTSESGVVRKAEAGPDSRYGYVEGARRF